MLASGSKDNYIRLWRISRVAAKAPPAVSGSIDAPESETSLESKAYPFSVGSEKYVDLSRACLWRCF
jgi:hypothetical protein